MGLNLRTVAPTHGNEWCFRTFWKRISHAMPTRNPVASHDVAWVCVLTSVRRLVTSGIVVAKEKHTSNTSGMGIIGLSSLVR